MRELLDKSNLSPKVQFAWRDYLENQEEYLKNNDSIDLSVGLQLDDQDFKVWLVTCADEITLSIMGELDNTYDMINKEGDTDLRRAIETHAIDYLRSELNKFKKEITGYFN